jgi:hypothetical protein
MPKPGDKNNPEGKNQWTQLDVKPNFARSALLDAQSARYRAVDAEKTLVDAETQWEMALDQARMHLGLTITDLARLTGHHRTTVSQVLAGDYRRRGRVTITYDIEQALHRQLKWRVSE